MVAESERAGYRFVRRLADEWADGANRFDRPGEVLFAAWMEGRLIGACGLNVDPYTRAPGVGRGRHLYVLTDYRRSGVGRRLVEHQAASKTRREQRSSAMARTTSSRSRDQIVSNSAP